MARSRCEVGWPGDPARGMVASGSTVSTVGPNHPPSQLCRRNRRILAATPPSQSVPLRKLSILRGTPPPTSPAASRCGAMDAVDTEATVTRLSAWLSQWPGTSFHRSWVQTGRVTVLMPAVSRWIVHGSEYMTVRSDGGTASRRSSRPRSVQARNGHAPADGWNVGKHRIMTAWRCSGIVVRSVPQGGNVPGRSDSGGIAGSSASWTRLCTFDSGSSPGPSQLCICVRTDRLSSSDTGMLVQRCVPHAEPMKWQRVPCGQGKCLPTNTHRNSAPRGSGSFTSSTRIRRTSA